MGNNINSASAIQQLANAPNTTARNAQGAATQRNLTNAIRSGNSQEARQIIRTTPVRRLSAVSWVVLIAAFALAGMISYIPRLARARANQNWNRGYTPNQAALLGAF
jgi:hypothetical protein